MNKKSKKNQITLREFTKSSALAAMGFQVVSSRVFGANNRLAVAAIGAGGKGRADIAGVSMLVRILLRFVTLTIIGLLIHLVLILKLNDSRTIV